MANAVELIDFRRVRKGTLLGFATVRVGRSMCLHDVTLHRSHGRFWASPPGRPQITREGAVMRGADGKLLYTPTISFQDRAGRDDFSDAVVKVVRARHPDALEDDAPEQRSAGARAAR